jgi:superfamily II DNA or RNA helicase
MTGLHPHQQELLQILEDPGRPRFGVIESPPGAGVGRVLALYAGKVGAGSRVLILCTMRMLVDQWAERLRADEGLRVTVLDSARTSLELLDGEDTGVGVLVATYARVRQGLGGRALAGLDYGLILLDQPKLPLPDEVSRLASRAREGIALVHGGKTGQAPLGWPPLWDAESWRADLPPDRLVSVQIPARPTQQERTLRDDATALLREDAARSGQPLVLPSDSLPSLHARLLGLASDSREPRELARRAWQLLDLMEGPLTQDSRLAALDGYLSRTMGEGGRCAVITAAVEDASYIADHCAEAGRRPRAVISSTMKTADMRTELAGLRPGEYLVATRALIESRDGWPPGVTIVLWPSPASRSVLDDLTWIAEGSPGLTVAEIREPQ